MRTIYKNSEGVELQVGDVITYHPYGQRETRGYTILRLRNDALEVSGPSGSAVVYHRNLQESFPGVLITKLPEVGYFNRVTGLALATGDTLAGGTIDFILDDALRFALCDGEELHRIVEVDPSIENLEWGVEIRIHPTESEISMGLPRILRSDGVSCVKVDGVETPVTETVWLDSAYHRIDRCHILRGVDRRLILDTADMRLLEDGSYGLEDECVRLTDEGVVVHMLDAVVTSDGAVIRAATALRVRNTYGEISYCSSTQPGLLEVDGCWCRETDLCECAETGVVMHRADARDIGGRLVSHAWAADNARQCPDCGRWYCLVDAIDGQCPHCWQENRTRIRNYSSRGANSLTPEKDVPIKFGIELEVGCDRGHYRDVCASVMADALDVGAGDVRKYAEFKHDGSLVTCDGFEVVTRPDCPSVHKRIWDAALSQRAVSKHMSSFDNGKCGIHIHVSRAPLSDLWIGRMILLVNSPKMQKLVHTIAGRGPNTYTCYNKDKTFTSNLDRGDTTRYEALNTTGERTIEFRMFRGTLNRKSFLKNIEFVEAAIAYTRPCERSLREVDVPELFTDFIAKSRKSYPNLFEFLKAKGICNQ